jgi:Fe-S cluster assembly ATP-binding protein
MVLEVKGLCVSSKDKEIIKDLDLTLRDGGISVIMGPNGSGKSSICNALLGNPAFKVKGSIKLDGSELIGVDSDVRAREGLFLSFQEPEEIEGVKISNLIRKALSVGQEGGQDMDTMLRVHEEVEKTAEDLRLDKSMISRELNVGFSGGEKKRMELLQMIMLKPKVIIFDEIDSGLDVDGIRLIAKAMKKLDDGKRSFLIITHYPRILRYVKADHVHVLVGGRIVKSGGAKLAHDIEEHGYASYIETKPPKKALKDAVKRSG